MQFQSLGREDPLEENMTAHLVTLAWRTHWQTSLVCYCSKDHRVRHDWSDLAQMHASAYLRLLISLSAVLIPACDLSSPEFCMMYSAQKLNKQSDNIQPWHTIFPFGNQSIVPCLVLTVAWPGYRFLKRQGLSSSSFSLIFEWNFWASNFLYVKPR